MTIKEGLYILPQDMAARPGLTSITVRRGTPHPPDCPGGVFRTVMLMSGDIICPGCQHGPCRVPEGIQAGREIRIIKTW